MKRTLEFEKKDTGITWEKKRHPRTTDFLEDISINYYLNGKKSNANRVEIVFRNNCFMKITKTNFITIAPVGERLYFKEEAAQTGFKLNNRSRKQNSNTRQIGLSGQYKTIEWAETHTGDYPLLFDTDNGLWYVDTDV